MDLNRLYFEHQLSLMRLAAADDGGARGHLQSLADGFAQSIAHVRQDFTSHSPATCRAGASQ